MKKKTLWVLLSAGLIISCQRENVDLNPPGPASTNSTNTSASPGEQVNIFKGPMVNVGNGKVRSWIKVNHLDQPLELGIEMTSTALTGLPEHHDESLPHPRWNVPLHAKAKELTPYDHLELNWNPNGHPPAIFSVPHFDVHFYTITLEEQMAIPPYTPGSAFDILPPPAYRPAGYVTNPGEGVAQMGKHWIAPPILPPFTKVMIWGSYDGEMIFVEPMVALSYLESGASSSQVFGQPQMFPKPGNYPTTYNIYKAEDKHYISLSQFVPRQ